MIVDDFPNEDPFFPSEGQIPWPENSARNKVVLDRSQVRSFVALSPWFVHESLGKRLRLFGCKYNLANAIKDGVTLPVDYFGFFAAFYLIEENGRARELIQRGSVTFCERLEENDFVAADDLSREFLHAAETGGLKWKNSDAIWPTLDGELMRFVAQFHIASTKSMKKFFFPNKNIYLFWAKAGQEVEFKIFTQDARYQTAERHYAEEVKRSKREDK